MFPRCLQLHILTLAASILIEWISASERRQLLTHILPELHVSSTKFSDRIACSSLWYCENTQSCCLAKTATRMSGCKQFLTTQSGVIRQIRFTRLLCGKSKSTKSFIGPRLVETLSEPRVCVTQGQSATHTTCHCQSDDPIVQPALMPLFQTRAGVFIFHAHSVSRSACTVRCFAKIYFNQSQHHHMCL